MIPFAEYDVAAKAFQRRGSRAILFVLAGLLVGLCISTAIGFYCISHVPVEHRKHAEGWEFVWQMAGVASMGISIPILFLSIWLFAPDIRKISELNCPGCKKPLQNGTGTVTATGKCPSCLKHVVKLNAATTIPHDAMLTIAQLQRAKRNQVVAALSAIFPIVFGMLLFALAAIAFGFFAPEHWWVLKQIVSVGFWIVLSASLLSAIFFGRRSITACPNCKTWIGPIATTIASGNCPHCSMLIVKDAAPFTEFRSLPKLEEVKRAARRYSLIETLSVIAFLIFGMFLFCIATAIDHKLPLSVVGNGVRATLYFLGTAIAILPCFWIFVRRKSHYPELNCKSCSQPIYESMTILRCTGNCPHCGQRAIKDV